LKTSRRKHTSAFKAKVALAAVRGEKMLTAMKKRLNPAI
jgi:hypothetical protein